MSDSYKIKKVSDLNSHFSDQKLLIEQLPISSAQPACYKSDERYFCDKKCIWRSSCKELTASWLR